MLTGRRLRYEEGCPPGGYDPAARLQVMDDEDIDIALLYPTIGICWEGLVTDPALATAYTRAYNRYIVDFCSHDPARLVPVAHISLIDETRRGRRDQRRAREAGCRAVYLSPDLQARGGRGLNDPAFDHFWGAAADLDMPVGFHVVVRDKPFFSSWSPARGAGRELFGFTFLAIDVMAAFTQMLACGVFERHPEAALHGAGVGRDVDLRLARPHGPQVRGHANGHPHRAEAERLLLPAVPGVGRPRRDRDRPDHRGGRRRLLRVGVRLSRTSTPASASSARSGPRVSSLPEADQAKVLGLNAQRFYGLELPARAPV